MNETRIDRVRRRTEYEKGSARAREREQIGWLREFLRQFELAWQLLWDGRVPFSTKLVPLLTALYFVFPIDFIPDTLLGLGQVDDIVLILVGLRMFISLCPPDVVSEYERFGAPAGERDQDSGEEGPEIIELEPQVPREGSDDSWQTATLRPSPPKDGSIEKSSNKDL